MCEDKSVRFTSRQCRAKTRSGILICETAQGGWFDGLWDGVVQWRLWKARRAVMAKQEELATVLSDLGQDLDSIESELESVADERRRRLQTVAPD